GARAPALPTGNAPTAEQIDQAVAAAGRNDVVVVLTNGAWQTDRAAQLDLVRALQETGKPVVAVATGDPYDAGHVDAPAWVATYSDKAVAMESLTKVLFGEISPTGELPVPVPDPNQPGADKYPFGHG
ncbi:glycoside hydrolase family 3 C-terminal domain-containing protein, partial [Klebsiella pneumoniae]|nr:glycoside hydrolase family 3 C-terminal domain-containing protein [Klebsiella pneumoniae]